jgi:hypothetical protein
MSAVVKYGSAVLALFQKLNEKVDRPTALPSKEVVQYFMSTTVDITNTGHSWPMSQKCDFLTPE